MKAVMYLVLLLLLHFLIEETESKAAKGKKKGCCGWWSRNCSCHHRDLSEQDAPLTRKRQMSNGLKKMMDLQKRK